jgi:hypothetical protein
VKEKREFEKLFCLLSLVLKLFFKLKLQIRFEIIVHFPFLDDFFIQIKS